CGGFFITKSLLRSEKRCFSSLPCLCLNLTFLSALLRNDPIVASVFKSRFPPLCHAILSSPLCSRLSRQELNVSPVSFSINIFKSSNAPVQGKAYFVVLEYVYA